MTKSPTSSPLSRDQVMLYRSRFEVSGSSSQRRHPRHGRRGGPFHRGEAGNQGCATIRRRGTSASRSHGAHRPPASVELVGRLRYRRVVVRGQPAQVEAQAGPAKERSTDAYRGATVVAPVWISLSSWRSMNSRCCDNDVRGRQRSAWRPASPEVYATSTCCTYSTRR